MLMARPKVTFQEGKPPLAFQAQATPAKYTRWPDTYYYRSNGGPLTKVVGLKSLLADMPGDQQALAELAKLEKLSVRKREDLIRLVKYANGNVQWPTCLPPIHTPWMLRQFLTSCNGSASSTTRSAHFPGSRVPTPSRSRHRAASLVAESNTCAGVIPASAIISISMCSKYPWKRAGIPLSVPKAMVTPLSASIFRFDKAVSSDRL